LKILNNLADHFYILYYRSYLIFKAVWIIKNPKFINPPKDFIECQFDYDPGCDGFPNHNFLLVPKKFKPENRWFFWKRHFAYQIKGDNTWLKLPSFIINEIGDEKIKYGFNHTLVNKFKKYPTKRKFITW